MLNIDIEWQAGYPGVNLNLPEMGRSVFWGGKGEGCFLIWGYIGANGGI